MKKEIVQDIIIAAENLLESLEGTAVSGDEYKLKKLSRAIDKLRELVEAHKPTAYQEYSDHTRILYLKMQKASKTYEDFKKIGIEPEDLKVAKENYEDAAKRYDNAKKIRDMLKES